LAQGTADPDPDRALKDWIEDFGVADRDSFVRSEQTKMISIAVLQPSRTIASVAKATASLPNSTDLAIPNACEVSPRVKPLTVGSRTPTRRSSDGVMSDLPH